MGVFVSAVESGSFTGAAHAHGITPAMVSKHVTSLERRLGATLLARTTRKQKLTEVGRSYYANCKQILEKVAAAEAGAESLTSEPRGHLRVNAPVSFGSLRLAAIVCDYLQAYPEVTIEFSLIDRYIDIVDEGFDVAVRIGELEDSSLVARKIAIFEVAVCAAPSYIAKFGRPTSPQELAQHTCLGFTGWQRRGGWKLVSKSFETTAVPRFQSDNSQALRIAAISGLGVIMMPRDLIDPDLRARRLVELLKEYTPPPRPIYAVYPKERQFAPKLTSFVDFISGKLRNQAA